MTGQSTRKFGRNEKMDQQQCSKHVWAAENASTTARHMIALINLQAAIVMRYPDQGTPLLIDVLEPGVDAMQLGVWTVESRVTLAEFLFGPILQSMIDVGVVNGRLEVVPWW